MTGVSNGSQGNQVGTAANPINPLLAPLGRYGGPTADDGAAARQPRPRHRHGAPAPRPPISAAWPGVSGKVDIGAFESQGFTLTPVAGSTPQATEIARRSPSR